MTGFLRRIRWWLQRRRREHEFREELEFHLSEETEARQADGLLPDEAAWAARRDLGNAALLQEDVRALWSWQPLEQLAVDVRYGLRGMVKNRMFTALAALSLALGIGANTAIYSFMDAILWRALPVHDPGSLVVLKWRSQTYNSRNGSQFVMHSGDGETYGDGAGFVGGIFPFPAFEVLQRASPPVLASLFAHKPAGRLNVIVNREAELTASAFVSGGFFDGLALQPAAGRLIDADDDREGAPAVAVLSQGYSERRFGGAAGAIGQSILINNAPFTVVGVAPAEFSGVDPANAPQVYLPLHVGFVRQRIGDGAFVDPNYYWVEMMARLKPGVDLARAESALAAPFAQWVAPTACNEHERANLPVLQIEPGAAGLDSLRRQYSKPLYMLLTMVGLILALACANTANLLLARAAVRTREIAVRLSLGAGRRRLVRQLLTESVLLAALGGALGVGVAAAGIRVLTQLLANGDDGFPVQAQLNGHVLGAALGLSFACGVVFGLAPALQATRPALAPQLRDRSFPRVRLTQALVIAQIVVSLLLLVAAGLFLRTLSSLQSIALGFNRDHVLLFALNAPQAGLPAARVPDFYADLRRRLSEVAGVREATLSHASLIRAGRAHPIIANGQSAQGTRVLWAGPRFFTTMQIPIVRGREIGENDRANSAPVAVVSELFAQTYFAGADPVGRAIEVGGMLKVGNAPRRLEIVGVAANARYGELKRDSPPVVYVAYAQAPPPEVAEMTYALRTEGDPLQYIEAVRQIVREADDRMPVSEFRTQAADIDQTINQEIVFARLCGAFAMLAVTIACVGLYATLAYAVARRTNEIGLRMALGAGRWTVSWMVLREVCVLVAIGLAIAVPAAAATATLIEAFLFNTNPDDPQTLVLASGILLAAVLAAGVGPARRASRVDPMLALRHE